MAKYKIGQKFRDIEDKSIITILNVAPEVDFQGDWTYWCECLKMIKGVETKFYFVWDESQFERYAEELY